MAAVANGGRLVTPHVVDRLGLPQSAEDAPPEGFDDDPVGHRPARLIAGLRPETLATVREGLDRVVADPAGTAYGTVRLDSIAIAGKTGTAQSSGDGEDHAWFAGYAPAEQPELAFVVVLEHSGNAATAAGPIVKALVQQMQKLGML